MRRAFWKSLVRFLESSSQNRTNRDEPEVLTESGQ